MTDKLEEKIRWLSQTNSPLDRDIAGELLLELLERISRLEADVELLYKGLAN